VKEAKKKRRKNL